MGNTTSNQSSFKKLETNINAIAGSLITSSSFKDLHDSTDPAACDKLTLLTAKLLNKYASKQEIKYLIQQQKDKKLTPVYTKDDVYVMKSPFDDQNSSLSSGISQTMNKREKQKICYGLAEFYIRIYKLFNAIAAVTAYNGSDSSDKDSKTVCDRRLDILKHNYVGLKNKKEGHAFLTKHAPKKNKK